MPIYEYRCPDCGHEFEEIQKVSDPAINDCPSCGGDQVGKKIGRSSFALKGSGWYSDHYGLKSSGGASGGDGGGSSAPSGGGGD
jgi:putative FmdB family regulatory protein